MLFNSLSFLVFFPVVTTLYFASPARFRWFVLLIASCVFYAAFIPAYLLILFFLIAVDYCAGILIEKSVGKKRLMFLVMSIIANLSILFVFKYFNFVSENLTGLAHYFNIATPEILLSFLLPIGLSFHVFQSLSYTIEVYQGNQKAEKHFGIYALYVMFYPQLVAGPIERPQNLLHQFHEFHAFEYGRAIEGLKQMLWGFFQKVVVADRAAVFADATFNDPHHFGGFGLMLGTVFFAVQIYGDFAGYSNIAIGAAKVMGFKLMKNFNRPYIARSIAEFWTRWHISLSTWFRDYIYIPLGGNRVTKSRWYLNLLLTFSISGFWHGANWTFIIWGALNGLYLIFGIMSANVRESISKFFGMERFPTLVGTWQILSTFILTCFAWIFFRAKDLADAWYIVGHLFSNLWAIPGESWKVFLKTNFALEQTTGDVLLAVLVIVFMFLAEAVQEKYDIVQKVQKLPVWVRWPLYSACVWGVIIFGVFANRQFIYFQF